MHLIDSLEFDVALASEERAFAEQEQLQSFMRGPALRVIESVFDQVSGEARARTAVRWPTDPSDTSGEPCHGPTQPGAPEVWRLDRLEIDLGSVSGADLCGQWERRLRDRLLEQLRDRMQARPAAPPAGAASRFAATPGTSASIRPRRPTPGGPAVPGTPATAATPAMAPGLPPPGETPQAHGGDAIVAGARRQSDLDALHQYLVQGCLPWHLTWPAGRSFSAWAQTVVLRDAPALARRLRRADTGLRQRLTRRLAEQLTPAGLEHLARALGLPGHWPLAGWVDASTRRAHRDGVAEPADALVRRLWATVLDEALQVPASARNARHLRAALRIAAVGHGQAATPSRPNAPPAPETGSGLEPTAAVLRLRAHLRQLWQRRQSHGLDATLRDSLRSDAAALAAWVAETGQAAAARRWLSASLPSSTWQRLLDLLAPSAAPLYAPLLRRRPFGAAWMQLSRSDWALTRTRLREAALAAVLLDPPATASGPDWLHALARHAAVLLNVEATSVWAVWCGPAGRRMPVRGPTATVAASPGSTRPLLGRAAALAAGAQPRLDNADSARITAWLALSLRNAGARARWVDSLGEIRLQDLAAQVAPAEAPWLHAWTADSMWPLWSATGLHAQAGSPSSFWALWWARWVASVAHVDAVADATAMAGAGAGVGAVEGSGFDRAGFVDAWLRHVARRHGLPLSSYLPGLAARLKSVQRQQRHSRRQAMRGTGFGSPVASAGRARQDTQAATLPAAGPPAAVSAPQTGPARSRPPRIAMSEQDDPVALVLRRARALAIAPGGRHRATPRGEQLQAEALHAARLHERPALRNGAAGPEARAVVSVLDAHDPPNMPPTLRSASGSLQLPQVDSDLQPAAEPSDSVTAVWAWLMQDHGRLLLAQRSPALKASLEAALADPAFADELARRAPPALWPLLLAWLRPAACGSVVTAVARAADLSPVPGGGRSPARRAATWRLVLQHYFVEGRPHVPGEFERRLARVDRPRAWPEPVGTEAAALPVGRAQASRPPEPTRTAGLQAGQAVQVHNAGLVLLGAYAPRLFSLLGLTDGRAFVDEDAAARAVHLLQWLVNERSDSEEHVLVLNKLLCGVPLATPLPREVALQAPEKDAGRQMLQAVITHWNALGGTSVQGLRETFLQREGRLQRDDEAWRLRVAPRAFDMLLDRLPWGYATLRLPWMKEVLHVDWR